MKRSGGIIIIALAAALASGLAAASASTGTAAANDVVRFANAARAQHGLRPLQRSRALDRSAVMKGEEIRGCRTFSHTPCGMSFMRTFERTGYVRGSTRVGENLYWGSGGLGTPTNAIAGWLRSPPHRANLLSRSWRDIGVGMVYSPSLFGAQNVWLFVLQFGRR